MIIETSTERIAALFKALGDPTRLGIFQMLRCCPAEFEGVEVDEQGQVRPAGSLSVGEVCCRIGGSMSTISHHLKELRLAGLIRMEKRGRWIYCSVNPEALAAIRQFVEGEGLELCQKPVVSETESSAPQKCCPEAELASTSR
ncbi:MAG: ArsR/SmtB family transcription factor [Actinomycetota bacterium]